MAPAFDLNPDPAPGDTYLTTSIDTADDSADLRVALAVGSLFRLDDLHARRILTEVAHAVADWRRVAGLHGLTPSQMDEMSPAFAALDQVEAINP